eukprot:TRINITY_DN47231_c0_g1_i1.p1 TRINITY_DN47231_c0_g1~~TRINITY_DN47231_c0_g1_i1.p1  ORF type:complete len:1548 (+),score=282.68 TRINITY_DN47231_c0_g1_i1:109-4752(+)
MTVLYVAACFVLIAGALPVELHPSTSSGKNQCQGSHSDDLVVSDDYLLEDEDLMDVRLLQTSLSLSASKKPAGSSVTADPQERRSIRNSLVQEIPSIRPEWMVMLVYASIYVASVCIILHGMSVMPSEEKACGEREDEDGEAKAWEKGLISWLSVSWASPWCAKWGHSIQAALTKIKATQLPQLGSRVDQAQFNADQFEKLWAQEVREVGLQRATVWNVCRRMCPKSKLLAGCAGMFAQMILGQFYSVFLVRYSLLHFFNVQAWVHSHPADDRNVTNQILLAIFAFTAYPIATIALASFVNSISAQLDQRICGGMAVALFRKAQRLPSISKGDVAGAEDHETADLQTLLNYDVLIALQGGFEGFCYAISGLISLFALFIAMGMQLRLATFCAFGIAILVIVAIITFGAGAQLTMQKMTHCTDQRVVALREILFAIRVVKCYGWEEAMEKKLEWHRNQELAEINSYWNWLWVLTGIFTVFPRLLTWAGLAGYAAIYGAHDVSTIFTSLQILTCLQGSCEVFAGCMQKVYAIGPSVDRISNFLKLPEAPVLMPGGGTPDWIQLWPKTSAAGEHSLKIQGTFRWSEDPNVAPAVRDVNLDIPKGELVAVVGIVGSGKSGLLQAILGELPPDEPVGVPPASVLQGKGDAQNGARAPLISRPQNVAYCPQTPHIAEGTLKENVLLGQPLDQQRYDEAVRAASLSEDLKILPNGGHEAPIGGRGISLSGGQKARVSMARAAYHMNSELMLLDDPFGSVDAPTAQFILENLLLGTLMNGRTCIVTTQPDSDRLVNFHRVVLMSQGKVVTEGTPQEVMATEEYQRILSSRDAESFTPSPNLVEATPAAARSPKARRETQTGEALREEEFEGRPTLALAREYVEIGRWRHLLCAAILMCIMIYCFLLCDLVIARWTNEMAINPEAKARPFLTAYMWWLCVAMCFFAVAWREGQAWSMRVSASVHGKVIKKLLRAPIDRFFDRQPVGRILSRLQGDLNSIDTKLYPKTLQICTIVFGTVTPLIYVHSIMPSIITVMALPLYCIIYLIYERYRNTSVPMQYCYSSTKSDMNIMVTDVISGNMVSRAYGDQSRLSDDMCGRVNQTLKVWMTSRRTLRRWLGNRIIYLWSFLTSTLYSIALINPEKIGSGTLGICLTNLLLMQNLVEPNIDNAIGCLFELIAMARINEYADEKMEQEQALTKPSDGRYKNFMVRVSRADLRDLTWEKAADGQVLVKRGKMVLQSLQDGKALVVLQDGDKSRSLLELCPSSQVLQETHGWHRIVGVNDIVGDAGRMACELCDGKEDVVLDIRSGWMADGAKVELVNIKAGYANYERNVLKGINLTFEARSKVGIVGTTGCGKSSMLLVLLRILEPRDGHVSINGVSTSMLGLATLRGCLGLVPQDPVLFTGTIRHNLDPLCQFTDGRIWEAIRYAHLEGLVESLPGRLDFQIIDEGSNLSFGQRQLFCLARMVLRQPAVLLLDEATSAIDPRTQESVQETINSAFTGSTLVAIAHRLETILDFDHIVVLEQGGVAEQGSVKYLSQLQDGRLRRMLSSKKEW